MAASRRIGIQQKLTLIVLLLVGWEKAMPSDSS
jgi:hypothetical protein